MQTGIDEKYWFRQKKHGKGWEPVTWEGWLLSLVYMSGLLFLIFRKGEALVGNGTFGGLLIPAVILTILFGIIAHRKSEKNSFRKSFRLDR